MDLSGFGGGSLSLSQLLLDAVLLERSHEGQFVGRRLEATVSHLRGGIDEFQLDLFQCGALGVDDQRFAHGDDAFARSNAAALDHDKVVVDLTVVREAAHRGDRFVGQIVLGRSVVLDNLLPIMNEKEREENRKSGLDGVCSDHAGANGSSAKCVVSPII